MQNVSLIRVEVLIFCQLLCNYLSTITWNQHLRTYLNIFVTQSIQHSCFCKLKDKWCETRYQLIYSQWTEYESLTWNVSFTARHISKAYKNSLFYVLNIYVHYLQYYFVYFTTLNAISYFILILSNWIMTRWRHQRLFWSRIFSVMTFKISNVLIILIAVDFDFIYFGNCVKIFLKFFYHFIKVL